MRSDTRSRFFSNKYRLILYILGLAVVIGTVAISSWQQTKTVQAQLVNFFPTTCLGGWQQPELAAGTPDALTGVFSESNSAVFSTVAAPLYCGQFVGTLPPQTYHTRVTVRFSWFQEVVTIPDSPPASEENFFDSLFQSDEELLLEETTHENTISSSSDSEHSNETATSDTASEGGGTTTTSTTEASVDGLEEIDTTAVSTTTEVGNEEGLLVDVEADEGIPSTDQEFVETDDGLMPEDTGAVETDSMTPEPTPDTTSEPAPEPVSEPTPEPTAFWRQTLIPIAHAEDLADPVTVSEAAIVESTPPAPQQVSASTSALFEVQYTLDGVSWSTLGFVAAISNDVRFEIPKEVLPTAADIARLQIALVPVLTYDDVLPIYLDALWLEVTYSPLTELGIHRIAPIVPEQYDYATYLHHSSSTERDVSTSVSTSVFMNSLTTVKGIDDRRMVARTVSGTSTELWLFDMVAETMHRIGFGVAAPAAQLIASKDEMIFWMSDDYQRVYTYDLRTGGQLHEMLLVSNLPTAVEHQLTFPFTHWEVVWRGDQFYFFTDTTGEVVGDEDTRAIAAFAEVFTITEYLSDEQLHVAGFANVLSSE